MMGCKTGAAGSMYAPTRWLEPFELDVTGAAFALIHMLRLYAHFSAFFRIFITILFDFSDLI